MTLARRFAVLALTLSVIGTVVLGAWVSNKLEQSARAREAGSAAIYIGHFVSPLLQELASGDHLSQKYLDDLDTVLGSAAMRLRVVAIKVWSLDGRIIYSSNRESIGRMFPIEGALARALKGAVASEFNSPGAESEAEHARASVLLEVYAPIRAERTGEIIAVAEFYEKADDLKAHLDLAQFQSWFVTGIILVSIVMGFSTVVREGSRTIELQRRALTQKIADLSQAMAKRKELRERIERGARNAIEENERFLRMVGSELHDGPAQLISLALLRLDAVGKAADNREVSAIRTALKNAMRDIRGISAGLLLPNTENLDLLDSVRETIREHEMKTRSRVAFDFKELPDECPAYAKICLCRFIQEGLANAFRHAGGQGQSVFVEGDEDGIRAQVSDTGPGMPEVYSAEYGTRLGLIGLRGRIESIRGTFTVSSEVGAGTTLSAWLPLGLSLPHGT